MQLAMGVTDRAFCCCFGAVVDRLCLPCTEQVDAAKKDIVAAATSLGDADPFGKALIEWLSEISSRSRLEYPPVQPKIGERGVSELIEIRC